MPTPFLRFNNHRASIVSATDARFTNLRPRRPIVGTINSGKLVDAVFEGGGALGAAYVGALRCLHDQGIKFARVAGNSAGSITAAFIAAGFTAEEMQWLTSNFNDPNAAADLPLSLANAGINQPIPFRDFMDLPTVDTISTQAKRETILWKALYGEIIDIIGDIQLPIPVVDDASIDSVTTAIINKIHSDNGPVGIGLRLIPRSQGLMEAIVSPIKSTLKTLFPDNPLTVSDFLPDTSAAREDFADRVWDDVATKYPIQLLLTNLIHEGGIFEGDEFLAVVQNLLSRKVHNSPTRPVLFRELTSANGCIPLAVIGANISTGEMEVYSTETTPDMEVAEGVRRSMSIPFVYQPRDSQTGVIVDGGLVSNFPLWLFTDSGNQHWPAASISNSRAKLGFVLEDTIDAPGPWNVDSARFQTAPGTAQVDTMEVLKPILREKLAELSDINQTGNVDLPAIDLSIEKSVLLKEIIGVTGVDKENATRIPTAQGLTQNLHYFDIPIPLLGYHWLDFYVNEDRASLFAMWDRCWHATYDSLSSQPMNGSNKLINDQTVSLSPYGDQTPTAAITTRRTGNLRNSIPVTP